MEKEIKVFCQVCDIMLASKTMSSQVMPSQPIISFFLYQRHPCFNTKPMRQDSTISAIVHLLLAFASDFTM